MKQAMLVARCYSDDIPIGLYDTVESAKLDNESMTIEELSTKLRDATKALIIDIDQVHCISLWAFADGQLLASNCLTTFTDEQSNKICEGL